MQGQHADEGIPVRGSTRTSHQRDLSKDARAESPGRSPQIAASASAIGPNSTCPHKREFPSLVAVPSGSYAVRESAWRCPWMRDGKAVQPETSPHLKVSKRDGSFSNIVRMWTSLIAL